MITNKDTMVVCDTMFIAKFIQKELEMSGRSCRTVDYNKDPNPWTHHTTTLILAVDDAFTALTALKQADDQYQPDQIICVVHKNKKDQHKKILELGSSSLLISPLESGQLTEYLDHLSSQKKSPPPEKDSTETQTEPTPQRSVTPEIEVTQQEEPESPAKPTPILTLHAAVEQALKDTAITLDTEQKRKFLEQLTTHLKTIPGSQKSDPPQSSLQEKIDTAPDTEEPGETAPPTLVSDYSVLIVEDEPTARKILFKALKQQFPEWTIRTVSDGMEAVAVLGNMRPKLIISEVLMPHMDGQLLVKFIKNTERYKDTEIIIITALDPSDQRVRHIKANGVHTILPKPLNSQVIVDHIYRLASIG